MLFCRLFMDMNKNKCQKEWEKALNLMTEEEL
jgi:hypothetical protein